jgi:hypothetical protein
LGKLWDKSGKDTNRLASGLRSTTGETYLEKRSLTKIAEGKEETLLALMTHPLNTLFAMIISPNYVGLDLRVLKSIEHFLQSVSIGFLQELCL